MDFPAACPTLTSWIYAEDGRLCNTVDSFAVPGKSPSWSGLDRNERQSHTMKKTCFLIGRGIVGLLACCLHVPVSAQTAARLPVWIASWGASQQIPESQNALPVDDLRDATVRQIFHLSAGGPALRVELSNTFGSEALHFTSVHIAHPLSPSSPAIDPASDRPLTFAGRSDVTVPPGAVFISDPLDYPVLPLSDLAVTFHLDTPPSVQTGHPGARATSYYVHGDVVRAQSFLEPRHVDHWYQVSEIDVQSAHEAATVVALGNSITDGHGATTNGNDRWTDVLAERLQGSPKA